MTQTDTRSRRIASRQIGRVLGVTVLASQWLFAGTVVADTPPGANTPPAVNVAAVAPGDTAVKALLLDPTSAAKPRDPATFVGPSLPVETPSTGESARVASMFTSKVLSEERLIQTVPTIVAIAALGIGPLLILLTTGFVRISIVLALLRQAFGTAQVPSNQVMGALSLLLTLLLMTPVWNDVYQQAVVPLMAPDSKVTVLDACERGRVPVQAFMIRQLEHTGGADEVWLFWKHARQTQATPSTYEEVPFRVLLPAFVLNELKTAFLIGFQIYLPFLVIDLLVAGTTMAMGLSSLPSQSLSIPLKLVMFVLVDGWHLVVDLLLRSFVG
ncbi:MAG: flagellar type III secretion system pore protein FliP [Pirellulales bacterium]